MVLGHQLARRPRELKASKAGANKGNRATKAWVAADSRVKAEWAEACKVWAEAWVA